MLNLSICIICVLVHNTGLLIFTFLFLALNVTRIILELNALHTINTFSAFVNSSSATPALWWSFSSVWPKNSSISPASITF